MQKFTYLCPDFVSLLVCVCAGPALLMGKMGQLPRGIHVIAHYFLERDKLTCKQLLILLFLKI